jgi:outer membrane protein OmpA-like peptidoglycan-associated protein
METEYKLYITNPNYFNSTQNDFEKNLSGKIVVNEILLENGFTEKSAIGYVYGIPVPFINPQTNVTVLDNDGTMILNGEASLFSPQKILANEMLAIITETFFSKYGLNIDFSLDAPVEVTKVDTISEKSLESSILEESTTITPATASTQTGSTASGFSFNFDKDVTKKVLVGAGVIGAGALVAVGINSLKGKTASEKTSVAPIEDNKLKGIKILVPSQYIDVYEISKYGGAPALVTNKDSKQMVWLDKDYDRPEFLPSNLTSPQKLNDDGTGNFGINIHLGYPGGKKVGNWSEDGSQVFSTADELNEFFTLCEKHKEKYGNKLTYTLSTKTDWDEAQKNVQTNKAIPEETLKPTPPAVEEKIAATPSTPTEEVEEIVVTAFRNLNFDTNKSAIRPESFESLNKLADLLKKETSWKLKIEGHTDSVGSTTSNLDLSKRRAVSAKKYLVDKGVVDGMISTEGFGESKPIADNSTEEGRQKNRRVSLRIIKPDQTTVSAGESI